MKMTQLSPVHPPTTTIIEVLKQDMKYLRKKLFGGSQILVESKTNFDSQNLLD